MRNPVHYMLSLAFLIATSASAQVSGVTVVTNRTSVAPTTSAGWTDVTVACPAGMAALSGGLDTNDYSLIEITSLAPTFAGSTLIEQTDGVRSAANGWYASVKNFGAQAHLVAVSAVCAPLSNVVVSIASVGVPAGDQTNANTGGINALCPANTVAVGGGVDFTQPATMKVSANAPIFTNQYLINRPAGAGPAPIGWTGYARNEGPLGGLRVGAICAPLSGVTIVSTGRFQINPGAVSGFSAVCPSGQIALGGGVDTNAVSRNVADVSTPMFDSAPQFPANRASAGYEAATGWYGIEYNYGPDVTTAAVAVICSAGSAAPAGTGPVYEFYNQQLKHFFRTASPAEAAAIDAGSAGPGWIRTRDDFTAFLPGTASPGEDVCRFYNPSANTHFYTAYAAECASLKSPNSGWHYEGIAFRIQLPSGSGCAAGTIPIYRLYNNRFAFNDSNHRFTTSFSNVTAMQQQGWIYEGIAFCALDTAGRM